jgi:hypothetical protein
LNEEDEGGEKKKKKKKKSQGSRAITSHPTYPTSRKAASRMSPFARWRSGIVNGAWKTEEKKEVRKKRKKTQNGNFLFFFSCDIKKKLMSEPLARLRVGCFDV